MARHGLAQQYPLMCVVSVAVLYCAGLAASSPQIVLGNEPQDEIDIEYHTLARELRDPKIALGIAHQAEHPQATLWESDRDPLDVVLRRTSALLAHLIETSAARSLEPLGTELAGLREMSETVAIDDVPTRRALFRVVCRVRRKIAFANPLLDFNQLLFLKRHRARFNHMCDQYYGITAEPGGGLYVLQDPFSDTPQVRDMLAKATVAHGRLAGTKLVGGSFLAPDLSYDGQRVAFAYVECVGDIDHRHHTDTSRGHWHEGRSYHVFKANIDGSDLEQLTDGTWNDFDPCWLPCGRLAFITERRGGYLRCGRVCPTYTLFDMAPNGTNIRCLSYHETNEWHPSVMHDGRILYTRWDYVDRHGCTAHMPWTTTVDGRDARAVHGNFARREARPDMELDCQAIPGSHRFVATAAPHHGQAYGSLVIVDPSIPDDDAMAPVARLTPDVGFPESQGGAQAYGTPWPLDDKFYLCAYDASMPTGAGTEGQPYVRGNYGLYLIDVFGNKELLYRDPEIACQNPIPLVRRPMPPDASRGLVEHGKDQPFVAPPTANAQEPQATVAVVNVYDSMSRWPVDTKITALRVIQILPMTVPSGSPPHEIGRRIASGRDSVTLARSVLGTVPVEADGSIHFTVPAQKEIYFQALDERGLAVQSMRSSTYLQAGERMVCAGCHEPNHQTPIGTDQAPLALMRAPSPLTPDVADTRPFSYARLIQPVLDRHCVSCHANHAAKPMNLAREPMENKWFASYANLTQKHAFWDYGDHYRTRPETFGARGSKLLALLDAGHHGVQLPPDDFHRLTLWLDLSSIFYGVYEKEGGEAQLRGEFAAPTLE